MKRIITASALLLITTIPSPSFSDPGSFTEALSQGDAGLNFRFRHESVDQDGFRKDANAATLKTRLNYRSAAYRGLSLFVELDDVTYITDDDFNNLRNGHGTYPVIADPKGTDVNQFYVDIRNNNVLTRFGRQRVNLDNQRFVGGVGWRQNEQTYDGITFSIDGEKVDFVYGYVKNVSRIFGPEDGTPDKTLGANTHLLNAAIDLGERGKLSLYGYGLDIEDAPGASNRTLGIRYAVTLAADSAKFPLVFEWASQDDYGDNTTSYSADYLLAEAGVQIESFKLALGHEVLEGDSGAGVGFQTPLATLHKFQGWADKFLGTPAGGIEDTYLNVGYSAGAHRFALTFHEFDAEANSMSYGSEIDASWNYKFNASYSLLVKAARYNADDFSSDTTKTWIMLTASF